MRLRSFLSVARSISTRAFPVEKAIYEKLTAKFEPSQLQVQDVSGIRVHDSLHMRPSILLGGCGTFYAIVIASNRFHGLPIVNQHRLVTDALKSEIEGIHGLQVCHPQHVESTH